MTSNINALLDKCEDPEKMIDQYLRNLERDLGKVKAETASVMAEEKRTKRELDECSDEIDKMIRYAEKALLAGSEADARTFLETKQTLETKQKALKRSYDLAAENASKMRQMHEKLVSDVRDLNARRDAIKAKVLAAKAQQRINQIGGSMAGVGENLSAFDRMEAKADRLLDEANAMAELQQEDQNDDLDSLMSKYDAQGNAAVEDEVAALKAKLGL